MDPLNLILLVIVGLIFWRLRSVLGTRNDDEGDKPPRRDAYGFNRDAFRRPGDALRKAPPKKPSKQDTQTAAAPPPENLQEKSHEKSDASGRGLAFLRQHKPDFDEVAFLDGAKRAYEMILTAFADGDLDAVDAFLGPEIKAGFLTAIENRQQTGRRLVTEITRLDRPHIEDAMMENGTARVAVRYRADIISHLVAGETSDEKPLPTVSRDLWTFEQKPARKDSTWVLVATEAD